MAVPILYDVDLEENRLVMEYVEGPLAKEVLEGGGEAEALCSAIGGTVGRLHGGDLVHGDLTTSNMILQGDRLVLLDLGLGERSGDLEAKGVDLHLLREAFFSAHSERGELFPRLLEAYRETYGEADGVIAKMKEIERRGRYLRGS